MNITIIGASAGIILETVKIALLRKHNVSPLSRSDISLPNNTNLPNLKGRSTNKNDLKKSIENADAVILTLGSGMSKKATTFYSDFATLKN